jgi:hypothetical protein
MITIYLNIYNVDNKIYEMIDIKTISRDTTKSQLYFLLNEYSVQRNLPEVITDCFYIRDHRQGRGERYLGRMCFNWIADIHPSLFLKLLKHIPEFGRWDDLLFIRNRKIRPYIYKYISNQLNQDIFNMSIGLPISTCAKWMPTEGKSYARHYKEQFYEFLQFLKLKPKEYRIQIATLRQYLNIPENLLCKGQHVNIDETQLTKEAKKLYKKALLLTLPEKTSYPTKIKDDMYYKQILSDLKISV